MFYQRMSESDNLRENTSVSVNKRTKHVDGPWCEIVCMHNAIQQTFNKMHSCDFLNVHSCTSD